MKPRASKGKLVAVLIVVLCGVGVAVAFAAGGAEMLGWSPSPEREPAPVERLTQVPPDATGAQQVEAARVAAEQAGQGAVPGSVRLGVAPSSDTRGWSMWTFMSRNGELPAIMLIDPHGKAVTWGGCRDRSDVIYRCGGSAGPDGFVLSGRTNGTVEHVQAITAAGKLIDGVLGDGAWLVVVPGGATPQADIDTPKTIIASDSGGNEIGRIEVPVGS